MRLVSDSFSLLGVSGWLNFQAEHHPDNKIEYGIKYRLYDRTDWVHIDRKSLEFITNFTERDSVVNGFTETINLNCGGYILCKEMTNRKVLISMCIHSTPLSFIIEKQTISEQLKAILGFNPQKGNISKIL